MNRIIFVLLLSFSCLFSNAQLKQVSYRGAFAPSPTPPWTVGWTNFDPKNTVYPSTTVNPVGGSIIKYPATGSGAVITTNTTWTKNNVYILNGLVYVKQGVTLTIQPGTVIYGGNQATNSSLVITKGAKLIAIGTPTEPIVFTSMQPLGFRNPGNWGGIILLGKASINSKSASGTPTPSTQGIQYIEGITAINDTAAGKSTEYGGGATPNDDDTSGTLKYVRIEFGGYIFEQNKEINGLTMGGVGRGTTIDYVQCSYINDDDFEWFGGTVNCSHLVSFKNVDDEWDSDFGFSGTVQFCLGVRDPLLGDDTWNYSSSSSQSEGFESDNDGTGTATTPKTRALFANITNIGPLRGNNSASNVSAIHPGLWRNAHLRRNSEIKIYNSILSDYPTGLCIDNTAGKTNGTSSNNALVNKLRFNKNIVSGYKSGGVVERPGADSLYENGYNATTFIVNNQDTIANNNNDTLSGKASTFLVAPYGYSGTTVLTGTGGTGAPAIGAVWPSSAYVSADYRPKTSVTLGVPDASTGADWDTTSFGTLRWTIDTCANVVKPTVITGVSVIIKGCDSIQSYKITSTPGQYYYWTVPTGNTILYGNGGDSISVKLNYNTVSTNTISVIASNGCKSASATSLNVSVAAVPTTAPASITQTLISNNCGNRIYRFTVPTVTGAKCVWTLGTGTLSTSATPDSGSLTESFSVRIKFTSNDSAEKVVDSIKAKYVWNCGQTLNKSALLSLKKLSAPAAPTITATVLNSNACGARRVKYTASSFPAVSATNTAATGYKWSFVGSVLNTDSGTAYIIDSGSITSQSLVVKYLKNNAAASNDSIRCVYTSTCGDGTIGRYKNALTVLNPPAAPTITATVYSSTACGGRLVKYAAPSTLPAATTSTWAARGYKWSFVGSVLNTDSGSAYVIDTGSLTSQYIVVRYLKNSAAASNDSIRCVYTTDCADGTIGRYKNALVALNPPAAPTITATVLNSTACGGRLVKYAAPSVLPAASSTTSSATGAATGYKWSFVGSVLNTDSGTAYIIDTGSLTSQYIVVRYLKNSAAASNDSIRCAYTSNCGDGTIGRYKNALTALNPPAAPTITATVLNSTACGARRVKYAAPSVLPAASSTTGAATGYKWSFVGSVLNTDSGTAYIIDSGSITSQYIVVRYLKNSAAASNDSIRCAYTSNCGDGTIGRYKNALTALSGCPVLKSQHGSDTKAEIISRVYPNPNKGNFTLYVTNTGVIEKTKSLINIIDKYGNIVSNINAINENGTMIVDINEPKLSNGVYFLRYKIGNVVNSIKLLIIK